jgi:hypothetical protein
MFIVVVVAGHHRDCTLWRPVIVPHPDAIGKYLSTGKPFRRSYPQADGSSGEEPRGPAR